VHVLELEARDLADDGRRRVDAPDELCQRAADVAGHRRTEDVPEELARRRLAVRPGDRHERIGQQPGAELDLRPDRDPALARGRRQRRLARHAGALHQHVDAVEQRQVAVVPELPVGDDHLRPARLERRAGRLAGAREPDHERTPREAGRAHCSENCR
jgi:hypothetical protein